MATYCPSSIAEARRAAGLSRREVAAALGCSPWSVTSYELAKRLPNADRLGELADLLGVEVSEFYAEVAERV